MNNRFLPIDALRGLAMVLVILQHSYLSANMQSIPKFIDMLVWSITGLAAVAFVAISGVMYRYFLYIRPGWRSTYYHYAGRALFLLLAVHPAINLTSCFFRLTGTDSAKGIGQIVATIFLDFPITDTIGLCILLTPLIIISFNTFQRCMLIVAMLIITVFMRAFITPHNLQILVLNEAFFGGLGLPKIFWFPIVPWTAIFLTGSLFGHEMVHVMQGTLSVTHFINKLNRTGYILTLCYVILMIGYKISKIYLGSRVNSHIFLAISPSQTTIMLPGYFAFLCFLIAALMYRIIVSGRYSRLIWLLSISGRTSLFTYVVQFIVVESVPALLGYKGMIGLTGFVTLFIIGMIIMTPISYAYGRIRGWILKDDYVVTAHLVGDNTSRYQY